VRIFDTATGKKVQEVRRGTEKALIYSISFSHDSNFLATSSDKGTIHIFGLNKDTKDDDKKSVNRTSKLGIFGGYFSSEWSFAWWSNVVEAPSIVSFVSDNKTLIVVSADGSFIRLSFDPVKGGECLRKAYNNYLKK
jgi:WD repeat-containing protein 45